MRVALEREREGPGLGVVSARLNSRQIDSERPQPSCLGRSSKPK